MTFRVLSELKGSVSEILKDREHEAAHAITGAMKQSVTILKNDWRAQIEGAGLSHRVANTVRGVTYPRFEDSLHPTGMVHVARGTPEKLLNELENGAIITTAHAKYFAIPTQNVPKGTKGTRITAKYFEQDTGIPLRFAKNRRGTKMLVGDAVKSRNGRSFRPPTRGRMRQGRKVATTVFYILVPPPVSIRKRLSLMAAAERVQGEFAALVAERLS